MFMSLIIIAICCTIIVSTALTPVERALRRTAQLRMENEAPPVPSSVQEKSFQQLVDHYLPDRNETFSQRYYLYYGTKIEEQDNMLEAPIFLLLGDEHNLTKHYIYYSEVRELADLHGAVLLGLEHRFYGESYPTNSTTEEHLHILSTEQALADISYFIQMMSTVFEGQWMLFGCGYAGSLAVWSRVRFPHQSLGALASSAPVEAKANFFEFDQSVAAAAGTACAYAVQNGTAALVNSVNHNALLLKAKFGHGCEDIDNNIDFEYAIASIIAYTVQADTQFQSLKLKETMCQGMMSALSTSAYIDIFIDTMLRVFNATGMENCKDWTISSWTDPDALEDQRSWMWQSCTELGYFQTASPTEPSMRSTRIDLSYHLHVCERLFNMSMAPRWQRTNAMYGGKSPSATNIILSTGEQDPWWSLSITETLRESMPAIVVANASHCPSWYADRTGEPAVVVHARQLVAAYVEYFLQPSIVCGKCLHGATCILTEPAQNSGSSVISTCKCVEGWQGANCDESLWVSAALYIVLIAAGAGVLFGCVGIVIGRWLINRKRRDSAYTQLRDNVEQ